MQRVAFSHNNISLTKAAAENNGTTELWRRTMKKVPADSVMGRLFNLLASDWRYTTTAQLRNSKMPFYNSCLRLMKVVDGNAALGADAYRRPFHIGVLWDELVANGLRPWSFKAEIHAFCERCGGCELVDSPRIGTIGAVKFTEVSIADLAKSFFIPPNSLGQANHQQLQSCESCGDVELTDVQPFVAMDLPQVLIFNFYEAKFLGDATPSSVLIRFLGTDAAPHAVEYQWLWSICDCEGSTDSGVQSAQKERYRLYHSRAGEGSALLYDPSGSTDGRLKSVKSPDSSDRFTSKFMRKPVIVALERKPMSQGRISYSEVLARDFGALIEGDAPPSLKERISESGTVRGPDSSAPKAIPASARVGSDPSPLKGRVSASSGVSVPTSSTHQKTPVEGDRDGDTSDGPIQFLPRDRPYRRRARTRGSPTRAVDLEALCQRMFDAIPDRSTLRGAVTARPLFGKF